MKISNAFKKLGEVVLHANGPHLIAESLGTPGLAMELPKRKCLSGSEDGHHVTYTLTKAHARKIAKLLDLDGDLVISNSGEDIKWTCDDQWVMTPYVVACNASEYRSPSDPMELGVPVAPLLRVLPFASTDWTRENIHCVHLNSTHAVATDGHTLCEVTTASLATRPYSVPTELLEVAKAAKCKGLSLHRDTARLTDETGATVYQPLVTMEFPPYQRVIPDLSRDGYCATLTIPPKSSKVLKGFLKESKERAVEKPHIVYDGEAWHTSAAEADVIKSRCNANYWTNAALAATETGHPCEVWSTDEYSAVAFVSADCQAVVMPVKL